MGMAAVNVELMQALGQVIAGAQTEIAILLLAILTHTVFFGKHAVVRNNKLAAKNAAAEECMAPRPAAPGAAKRGAGQPARQPRPERQRRGPQQEAARTRQAAVPRSCAAEDLREAFETFHASQERTSCLYNTLLQRCIECRDIRAADQVMAEAVEVGLADVVTYNTMVKARLQAGNLRAAREAIETMKGAGLQPNSVTYNELLDATVGGHPAATWDILREMKASGLKPNPITVSILLKSIQPDSPAAEVERSMELAEQMEDKMDEVLLSSVVEACVRAGRPDLLKRQLARQRTSRRVTVKGAHTYGSLIRAFGAVQDLAGAHETWREMVSKGITPTSITFGCMVEALVSNGDPDGAHQLIRDSLQDAQTRPLVNAVIYCSVLKGFSHMQRFECVWTVYEEMVQHELKFTVVTFNALIDACVRCGQISRAPALLADMFKQGISPNLITYSSILKGYCQESRMDKALELLGHMKQASSFRPDEVTYNTLLDGCARQGLYDQGLSLLEEMQQARVRPSNYTLSVLVKLANRSKHLEQAFVLCDTLSTRYNFRLNSHVYNNLIHACITHKDVPRALEVFNRMADSKVRPDSRTYALLLPGCTGAGLAEDAAGLLRSALGLRGGHRICEGLGQGAKPGGGVAAEVVSQAVEGIARECGNQQAALQLLSELRRVPGLRLDPKLSVRLTTRAIHTSG